jgi:hypothetical protein
MSERNYEMLKAKNHISIVVIIITILTLGVFMPSAPSVAAADSVKVAAPKSVKAKAGTGKVTLNWKRVKSADGYYVYMAKAKKNGKAGKYKRVHTIKANKAKCTVNFVDKGTYYIKAKAYKTVDGRTYQSRFSKRANVAVKKESTYYICTCGKKFGSETAVEKHQKHYRDLWMEGKISGEEMDKHLGWRSSTWDIDL